MLIDTSGWFSMLDRNDAQQQASCAIYGSAILKVTHSFVIAELVALCTARRFPRQRVLSFISELLADDSVHVVWVDENLTNRSFHLLNARPDKAWSLCDAVSFVLMTELGLTDALTTDHHFEQAGFVCLLNSSGNS